MNFLDIISVAAGLVSAILWWSSAIVKIPHLNQPKNFDDLGSVTPDERRYFNQISNRNKWAAATTALAVATSAISNLT